MTPKQKRFCEEYLIDLNATQSAIRAGYSKKTADRIGTELLGKTCVSSYLSELIKAQQERTEVTADMVIKELAKTAFSDIRKLYRADGSLLSIQELDIDTAASISSFKLKKEVVGESEIVYTSEYKRFDKIKALELLGKHFNLFSDTVNTINHQTNNTLEVKFV